MRRRDFGKASLVAIVSSVIAGSVNSDGVPSNADFPKAHGLTEYVGKFVWQTKYEDLPGEVIELGKKSILDGLGLALAGSKAQSGALCRQYLETIGVCDGKSTIIGSGRKTSRPATTRMDFTPLGRAGHLAPRRLARNCSTSKCRKF